MSTSRRRFLASLPVGATLGAAGAGGGMASEFPPARKGGPIDDMNRQLTREGRPIGLKKDDLPTPALIVDLDVFEANLRKMAEHARSTGKSLRRNCNSFASGCPPKPIR